MQIHDKALLVRLSVSMPGNSRTDKPITGEVINNHSLAPKAGRWNKSLYPAAAFEPLVTVAGSARTYSYSHTLPWLDGGWRILPTNLYSEYCAKIRGFRLQFEDLAESHFLGQLPRWEAEAAKMHNSTFRPEDYLPVVKLRWKFKFQMDCIPIPTENDYRCSLTAEDRAALQADLQSRLNSAVQAAQADLWSRLLDPLVALADRLKDADSSIRASSINALNEVALLVPKLNLTSDPKLVAFALQVSALAKSLDANKIKEFPSERNAASIQADAILAKMSGYLPTV